MNEAPQLGRPSDSPWCKGDRFLLAALLGVLLVSLIWTTSGHYNARNDASLYVVVTRSLLAGEGLTYLGQPFVIRPPGFAYLLAPVMWARGTDLAAFNLYVSLWGVAMAALLFVYLRPRTGGPLAAAAGLAVWFAPGVRELCNQVMSDVPGTALLLAVLILERRTRRAASPVADLGLGLAITAAAMVRTMNVLALPAVIGARLIDGAWRARGLPRERRLWLGCLLLFLGAAPPVAAWMGYAASAAPEGRTEQTHIHSYATAQWHEDPADPDSPEVTLSEFLGRAKVRVPQALASIGSRLASEEGGPVPQALGLVGLLAAALVFLRRREPGELFVLGSLLVVGTYFAFKPRLVLPLFVLSVGAAVEVLAWTIPPIARAIKLEPNTLRAGLAVVVATLALGLSSAPDQDKIGARDDMRRAIAEHLIEVTPPGARIAAATGWDLGVYLPERRVYSLRFAFKHGGESAVMKVLDDERIEYVALFQRWSEDKAILAAIFRRAAQRFRPAGPAVNGWTILRRAR
jgi:4-amino-4-deoxy-L-arabinose transferase-like glycosyltransferase